METLGRRTVLKGFAAAAALAAASRGARAESPAGLKFEAPQPFSQEGLKARARELASRPYAPPPRPAPDVVAKIDYEAWGKIHFRPEAALSAQGTGRFPVTFFHLGLFFQKAVDMHVVENGTSRRIVYDAAYFDMPKDSPARRLPPGAGFAGFRVQEAREGALDWRRNDWVAFLGASYFRAIGELRQYGLSARGVAIDVAASDRAEEFPDFSEIYIDADQTGDAVTVHALLDGPSVAGAYRFVLHRTRAVLMDVEATLVMRAEVARFGLAPLTSMYWYSETKKRTAEDWRPEVHDSDGLCMWSGAGERIWRPLNNPPRTMVSSFVDDNPRGFGLSQRDRVFDHYLDGVYYDRRPTLWVEPMPGPQGEGWGKGAIELCEIPTDDEIHDNIVAMWAPQTPPRAGAEISLAYRLHWVADEPFPSKLGRCVATRLGRGGQPGLARPSGVRKFVVEFLGGPLATLPFGVKPEIVVSASRGSLAGYRLVEAAPDDVPGHWRAQFDLEADGSDPVELRLFLQSEGRPLTETWLYQYHPF